jgi:hypothetical protein
MRSVRNRRPDRFSVLILIARPAAGKSEIIQYLRHVEKGERERRFHIGDFEEIDDFPMLWVWFEEDAILSKMGKPRLHTTDNGNFKYVYLWDMLIRRISLEYEKKLKRNPHYHARNTAILEFSRGREHGGFARGFDNLSDSVLESAAVVYINVSYAESVRKNKKRYNPDDPGSILQHSLPDEKMETLYRESDWEDFSSPDPDFLHVRGYKIPYRVFENEDDVTTAQGEPLGVRLEETLSDLWKLRVK